MQDFSFGGLASAHAHPEFALLFAAVCKECRRADRQFRGLVILGVVAQGRYTCLDITPVAQGHQTSTASRQAYRSISGLPRTWAQDSQAVFVALLVWRRPAAPTYLRLPFSAETGLGPCTAHGFGKIDPACPTAWPAPSMPGCNHLVQHLRQVSGRAILALDGSCSSGVGACSCSL